MKSLSLLALALALAGCGSIDRMSYGSWLDHVGEQKAARYSFSSEESQSLRERADELHAQSDNIRVKLAAEKDRAQRVSYLRQLEYIGDKLRPIEKQLREGGTNSRRYSPPPDYTQAGGQ